MPFLLFIKKICLDCKHLKSAGADFVAEAASVQCTDLKTLAGSRSGISD